MAEVYDLIVDMISTDGLLWPVSPREMQDAEFNDEVRDHRSNWASQAVR
ncbi:MAG: hypothetical protein J0I81_09405 [Hyphomicrobium sp.]|nr:hypothetical protein [Hyphomicrobium sp.]